MQRHQIFYSRCSVKNKVCNLIIINESCKNIVFRELIDHLKLDRESHPHSYTNGWTKKWPSIKVIDLYHVPISIDKFYQDSFACDLVEMGACHILLGRPWKYDVNATRGKMNIYMFNWKGRIAVMRLIPYTPKFTKEKEPKFTSICKRGKFLLESEETKQIFALVVKKEVTPLAEIPEKMRPLLEEFKWVIHDELPKGLPPMRHIQHHISEATLSNLSYYRMNLKENEVLKEKVRLKLEKINAKV